ncbi:type IV pilus assembly protein PilM [Desulfonauticus submarinus]|uniref:Type IV pilus assembly protein PilM n=1 Tax=Desulfonauticus submarinus TaxID=206665 RepID=A0A1H0BQJ5_9BACT|nr:type IV pilus assembly protein PilM [Desulfonauticus submarinus]SDN47914.1 type IV pilus assembly protein PilM [Desulfonauticus submarinus]
MFGQKTGVGLDLGARWIKLVALEKKGKKLSLLRTGRFIVPMEERGKEEFGDKLKLFFQSLKLKGVRVTTSVSGQASIVKKVIFKAKDEEDLEEVILKEAKQYIPFDMNEVVLDYQVLKVDKQESAYEVYLVACKKEFINNQINWLSKAKIKVECIDIDAFAISNVFEFNYPEEKAKTVFLFDIGERQSIFSVYSQGELVLFREMGFGGFNLTNRIASYLGVSVEDAERVKLNGGIELDKQQRKEVFKRLEEEIENWLAELRKVVNFYKTTYPQSGEAEKIFLSGGCTSIVGIDRKLSEEFEIPVDFLDPWRKIERNAKFFDAKYLDEIKYQMVTATGLALRGVL